MQIFLLSAQNTLTFTIQGRVTDSSDEPVIYAYVVIDSLNQAVATDLDGKYTLKNIPAGTHRLSTQTIGFVTKSITVKITNHSLSEINFILQDDILSFDEIFIKVETQKEKENTAEAVSVIETKEAKLQSADLREVMAKTEGINVQRAGGLV